MPLRLFDRWSSDQLKTVEYVISCQTDWHAVRWREGRDRPAEDWEGGVNCRGPGVRPVAIMPAWVRVFFKPKPHGRQLNAPAPRSAGRTRGAIAVVGTATQPYGFNSSGRRRDCHRRLREGFLSFFLRETAPACRPAIGRYGDWRQVFSNTAPGVR